MRIPKRCWHYGCVSTCGWGTVKWSISGGGSIQSSAGKRTNNVERYSIRQIFFREIELLLHFTSFFLFEQKKNFVNKFCIIPRGFLWQLFAKLNYLFLYFTSFYLIAKEKLRETEIVVTEDSQHRLLELMRQEVEKIKKEGNSLNKNNSPKKCPYSPNKLQSPGKKSPKKCPPSPKKFPNTSPDFLPSPDYEFFNPSNISSR